MTSCTHLTLLSIAKLYIFVNRISAIASRLSFCYSILITKVYPNAYLHNIFTVNKERSMTQGVSIATKKTARSTTVPVSITKINISVSEAMRMRPPQAMPIWKHLPFWALWISCRKIILSSPQPSPLKKSSCFELPQQRHLL